MAVFYVLPSRGQMGEHFQEFLAAVFPGLGWLRSDSLDLAEALAQAAESRPGVYVVFSEDLDDSVELESALAQDFGAEQGDEILVVRPELARVERRQVERAA